MNILLEKFMQIYRVKDWMNLQKPKWENKKETENFVASFLMIDFYMKLCE